MKCRDGLAVRAHNLFHFFSNLNAHAELICGHCLKHDSLSRLVILSDLVDVFCALQPKYFSFSSFHGVLHAACSDYPFELLTDELVYNVIALLKHAMTTVCKCNFVL